MNREEKTAVVAEIAAQIGAAEAIFAVDYRGISVSQVAALRDRLREADATFRIVKNSLTERAADQAGVADLKPLLIGPTALAIVHGDAALAAKALHDTARALNLLNFKGGLLNGGVLSPDDVRSIARLPSRDVLNAQLVGTIAAPLSGLVRGLNALIVGLAIQLKSIADQGLVSGTAPAAAEPAETEAVPGAVAEPEPRTAPEPEATPAPEPEAAAHEPEAKPAAEPEAAPAAEPEAAPAPEPEAAAHEREATPTAEPEAAPAPEPEAVAAPEPEAAAEPQVTADHHTEPEPQPSEQESPSDAEPSGE
jgi:large subunit ribosomal protein L10